MTTTRPEQNPYPELTAFFQKPENYPALQEAMVKATAPSLPLTVDWTKGERDGQQWAGLVLKRTYVLDQGRPQPAASGRLQIKPSAQEALMDTQIGYFDDDAIVRHAPPVFVNDYYAARQKTDVVIQGMAFAPRGGTRSFTVTARFGRHERSINVFGERRGDVDRMGRFRFSEPKTIDAVPLRYDFAYGGVDMVALARKLGYPKPGAQVRLQRETELHYPRNPCGLGYLIELDRESFNGLLIPHLEHPFDPLTPERLAVGRPDRWLRGPMPAAWDWQAESWFPRAAYLGLSPPFAKDGTLPAEVTRGLAPPDILDIPMIFHNLDGPPRVEYTQAASPGMSVDVAPDEAFEIHGMHPRGEVVSFRLPGEVPLARVAFRPEAFTDLEPRLCSVVIRPHRGEVIVVWSAMARVDRDYDKLSLMNLRSEIRWARGGGGAQ